MTKNLRFFINFCFVALFTTSWSLFAMTLEQLYDQKLALANQNLADAMLEVNTILRTHPFENGFIELDFADEKNAVVVTGFKIFITNEKNPRQHSLEPVELSQEKLIQMQLVPATLRYLTQIFNKPAFNDALLINAMILPDPMAADIGPKPPELADKDLKQRYSEAREEVKVSVKESLLKLLGPANANQYERFLKISQNKNGFGDATDWIASAVFAKNPGERTQLVDVLPAKLSEFLKSQRADLVQFDRALLDTYFVSTCLSLASFTAQDQNAVIRANMIQFSRNLEGNIARARRLGMAEGQMSSRHTVLLAAPKVVVDKPADLNAQTLGNMVMDRAASGSYQVIFVKSALGKGVLRGGLVRNALSMKEEKFKDIDLDFANVEQVDEFLIPLIRYGFYTPEKDKNGKLLTKNFMAKDMEAKAEQKGDRQGEGVLDDSGLHKRTIAGIPVDIKVPRQDGGDMVELMRFKASVGMSVNANHIRMNGNNPVLVSYEVSEYDDGTFEIAEQPNAAFFGDGSTYSHAATGQFFIPVNKEFILSSRRFAYMIMDLKVRGYSCQAQLSDYAIPKEEGGQVVFDDLNARLGLGLWIDVIVDRFFVNDANLVKNWKDRLLFLDRWVQKVQGMHIEGSAEKMGLEMQKQQARDVLDAAKAKKKQFARIFDKKEGFDISFFDEEEQKAIGGHVAYKTLEKARKEVYKLKRELQKHSLAYVIAEHKNALSEDIIAQHTAAQENYAQAKAEMEEAESAVCRAFADAAQQHLNFLSQEVTRLEAIAKANRELDLRLQARAKKNEILEMLVNNQVWYELARRALSADSKNLVSIKYDANNEDADWKYGDIDLSIQEPQIEMQINALVEAKIAESNAQNQGPQVVRDANGKVTDRAQQELLQAQKMQRAAEKKAAKAKKQAKSKAELASEAIEKQVAAEAAREQKLMATVHDLAARIYLNN